MKKIVAAVALSVFCVGTALAAGPATIVLHASKGDVTFPHKEHQEKMACTACHENDKGGKIAALGKDWAHKTCKGCHSEKGKGPTGCNGCHKK
ncbi:cytochrome c family protein [Geomonas sp. Red32]|uniref:cytochrome c3 family protein n=1 Tax=Geomonas sp. Red32 TaxID=2912856 RepID=UPI00202CE4B9|nr:cytochrome c3 family protein [Geomonas sp. Red32]MCM0080914.1 cytochrome c family protein [Geomonas sp. Red32]